MSVAFETIVTKPGDEARLDAFLRQCTAKV